MADMVYCTQLALEQSLQEGLQEAVAISENCIRSALDVIANLTHSILSTINEQFIVSSPLTIPAQGSH